VHLVIWFQEHAQTFSRSYFVIDDEDLGEFGAGDHSASAAVEARVMPRRGGGRKNIRQLISIRRAKVNQKPLARKVQLVNRFPSFGE
jgi:hypothetical protein